MRIGIMTLWQTLDNYGQVLQAYALQCVLRSMGHEPFIIRYELSTKPSTLRRLARIILFPIYYLRKRIREIKREKMARRNSVRAFNEFRQKHFSFSDLYYPNLKALRECPPVADCYIAGSDQVWGSLLSNPEKEAFYLSFGRDDIRRISYAASFGMKKYPEELKVVLKRNLSRFDSISCREYDGVTICEDVGIKAVKVLDPTFIAPLSIYENLKEEISAPQGKYMFLYSLNINEPEDIRWTELQNATKEKGLKTIVTIGSGYIEGKEIYDNVDYIYPTIGQWISLISNAEFVVTPSFHGVVFCLLFHRRFAYIPLGGNWSRANNRVFDLLRDINLTDRILTNNKTYKQLYNEVIDWNMVDRLLQNQINDSIRYLSQALKKIE